MSTNGQTDVAMATEAARSHNFSAGPAVLPDEVLLEVRDELPVYRGMGTSILEVSHRSPEYSAIAESARDLLRSLLGLSEEWHILFLQGGASLQFHQVPLNFLTDGGCADYIVTGAWAKKALAEATLLGVAHEAASSADENFTYIPDPSRWDVHDSASYLHITSNNTIFGTAIASDPKSAVPVVCDASSDFLSRPVDLTAYGLIYAGAQKNLGPAGVTIVLVRDEFLETRNSNLPTLLDYATHAGKLFHTPPVFAVYIVEKVLRWLERLGGLEQVEQMNRRKADVLYERIDRTDFYRGTAAVTDRSMMNVTFRLPSEDLEGRFIAEAASEGLKSLKGHRSVGGVRASIYNACPEHSIRALVEFMDEFERSAV